MIFLACVPNSNALSTVVYKSVAFNIKMNLVFFVILHSRGIQDDVNQPGSDVERNMFRTERFLLR